ncbi:MAG: hypothetical protein PHU14_08210 [Methylovulum sp.]|nr:hypothetical protein [Methylovulum sp.]
MLHSIEIEIDADGCLHSLEPLPVGRRGILTLFDEKTFPQAPLSASPSQPQNPFQDLFGILTAKHSVSLAEMEQAISQQAAE